MGIIILGIALIYSQVSKLAAITVIIEAGYIDNYFQLIDIDYLRELKVELYELGKIDKYKIILIYIHYFNRTVSGLLSLTALSLGVFQYLQRSMVTEGGILGSHFIKFYQISWVDFAKKGENYGELKIYSDKRLISKFKITCDGYEKAKLLFKENKVTV